MSCWADGSPVGDSRVSILAHRLGIGKMVSGFGLDWDPATHELRCNRCSRGIGMCVCKGVEWIEPVKFEVVPKWIILPALERKML